MKICEFKKNDLSVFEYIIDNNNREFSLEVDRLEDSVEDLVSFANDIRKEKDNFKKLITNYDILNNKNFYKLCINYYKINFNELNIAYFKNMFKKPKIINLKTDDVKSIVFDEGHGRDFSWWTEWYNVTYKVITSAEYNLDENKIYTKNEIQKLLDSKQIAIVNKNTLYGNQITNSKLVLEKSEDWKTLKLPNYKLHHGFNDGSYYRINDEMINEMYATSKPAFEIIKNELDKNTLIKDYNCYLKAYNKTMHNVKFALNKLIEKNKKYLNKINKEINKENNYAEQEISKIDECEEQNF